MADVDAAQSINNASDACCGSNASLVLTSRTYHELTTYALLGCGDLLGLFFIVIRHGAVNEVGLEIVGSG